MPKYGSAACGMVEEYALRKEVLHTANPSFDIGANPNRSV